MLNKKLEKAINDQVHFEIYSSYLYLGMSAYFSAESFSGFANWMKVQAQEEMTHAMKFYHYVYERGGIVELSAIAKPPAKFKSPLDVAEQVFAHEQKVTELINGLYELALKEKDYASQSFLKWFIDEQVEEEGSAQELVDKINLVGDKSHMLYMLDKELASRGKEK